MLWAMCRLCFSKFLLCLFTQDCPVASHPYFLLLASTDRHNGSSLGCSLNCFFPSNAVWSMYEEGFSHSSPNFPLRLYFQTRLELQKSGPYCPKRSLRICDFPSQVLNVRLNLLWRKKPNLVASSDTWLPIQTSLLPPTCCYQLFQCVSWALSSTQPRQKPVSKPWRYLLCSISVL